jgi:arylsulfatase A-like enzyme
MMVRNILFVMCDQLRWDYLSCYGHPHLKTPNIDKLAANGVRFDRAYVQSPVCGPSRMSFYTGRTVFSHGATWNLVPLPIGEYTIGDYLRPHGVRVGLAGKTHMREDVEGMARLGLTRETDVGLIVSEAGFEPFERDDGLHPLAPKAKTPRYNEWLKSLGYDGDNPWNSWANAAEGPNGEILTGWALRNSRYPSRIREEHSETPYITNRGIDFIRDCGERPWLLHLSYIKPHWPYIAPAPYHNLYSQEEILPVNRLPSERDAPHPVFAAFMNHDPGRSFSCDEVRTAVIPAYMGLIKQIDDQLGRLFDFLETAGRMRDTMIVFTSDHGDYLGDHWLGEKELFHEPSVRVPMIIYDPSPEADGTRGHVCNALVEAIDLVPTFLDTLGVGCSQHRLEGHSLVPFLRGGSPVHWRTAAFSEIDYAAYQAREVLGRGVNDCRAYMLRTDRWKYVHFRGYRPQLFDLIKDPDEFTDLGALPSFKPVRQRLHEQLLDRLTDRRNRVTVDDTWMRGVREQERSAGIVIGKW